MPSVNIQQRNVLWIPAFARMTDFKVGGYC